MLADMATGAAIVLIALGIVTIGMAILTRDTTRPQSVDRDDANPDGTSDTFEERLYNDTHNVE